MENAGSNDQKIKAQLIRLANSVPPGRVVAYGTLGSGCQPPISGYFCGRLMSKMDGDIPWWRVVAVTGQLPAANRSAELGQKQRLLLEAEGVSFDESGRIERGYFLSSLPSKEA